MVCPVSVAVAEVVVVVAVAVAVVVEKGWSNTSTFAIVCSFGWYGYFKVRVDLSVYHSYS